MLELNLSLQDAVLRLSTCKTAMEFKKVAERAYSVVLPAPVSYVAVAK